MAATPQPIESHEIQIRVGVYDESPLVWITGDLRPQGFSIELLKQIAANQNWQLRFHPGSWTEKVQELKSGRIDILPWSGTTTRTIFPVRLLPSS